MPEATLADFAQSYVFLKPVDELRGMTWIPGFISDDNFDHARVIALRMGWVGAENYGSRTDVFAHSLSLRLCLKSRVRPSANDRFCGSGRGSVLKLAISPSWPKAKFTVAWGNAPGGGGLILRSLKGFLTSFGEQALQAWRL